MLCLLTGWGRPLETPSSRGSPGEAEILSIRTKLALDAQMTASQPLNVLLVEDDPGDAALVLAVLRASKAPAFETTHVLSLHLAIEHVRTQATDVVLLDLSLPDATGVDTVTRMRHAAPRLPIVVMTGLDDMRFANRVMELGAQDYLLKDGEPEKTVVRTIQYSITRMQGIVEREALLAQLSETIEISVKARDRLSNILWGTGVGTWEWNVQTGEAHFNERWAEIIGYTLGDISPVNIKTWMSFAHPDDLRKSNAALDRHFSGKDDYYECEVRMRHKDGYWVWVLDRGKVTSRTDDGQPLWMSGTHTDISKRKHDEESIAKLLTYQRAILASTPIGICVTSLDRKIVDANLAFAEIFGFHQEELLGKSARVFFANEEKFEELGRQVYPVILRGGSFSGDIQLHRRDGADIWVHSEARLIDGDAPDQGVIWAVSNITERRMLETQLMSSKAELEKRVFERTEQLHQMAVAATLAEERERRAIAADLHDDLGQTLHMTRVKLESMEDALPKSAPINALMQEMKDHLSHASSMVRSLTSQLSPPALNDLGLVPALSWLAEEIKRVYGLTVSVEDDGFPKPLTKGQAAILFRTVRELLINVSKHARTEAAAVTVSASNSFLRICVRDEGIGIANLETAMSGKTGFGLASIRERITFFGGEVTILSRPNEGTTVAMSIPIGQKSTQA
ncbi:MAG: PAS domain-containing protein [Alphaproteobacteria bacterium]|nr:PAS domain-containing protein [Alphaproteobacteria bacterium]